MARQEEMQLQAMTHNQLNQLNIPNPDTLKNITEAAWRSRDGRYVVLKICFNAFTEDGGRREDKQIRFLRVYATDDRGIPMPIHVELMCADGVEAFILTEIDSILADKPDRIELSGRLTELWKRASRSATDEPFMRYHITLQGYAQHKTKGEQ